MEKLGKLVITSLLIGTSIFSFAGCGSDNSNEAAPGRNGNVQVQQQKPKEDNVPKEYKSALKKAQFYSDRMYMSKAGIYDQLTSEYGEKFSPEAAQYAIAHLKADFNKNALHKAKFYQDRMAMSPEAVRDQLSSEYGEKFTPEEADYAVQHLDR